MGFKEEKKQLFEVIIVLRPIQFTLHISFPPLFSGIFFAATQPKLINSQWFFLATLKRAQHWILFTILRWYLFTIPFYLRIEVRWSIVTWFTLSIIDNLYVIPVWSPLNDLFYFDELEFVVWYLTNIYQMANHKVCFLIIYCPSNWLTLSRSATHSAFH